ncbi:MAG: IS21 family transposase [Bacillota bacterium]|nr:IS21 family transposase [Bacillota bacterium]
MGNVLKMDKKELIYGLIKLGHSDRSINKTTGIHRKTISFYRKQLQNVPEVPTDEKSQNAPQVPAEHLSETNDVKLNLEDEPLPPTLSRQIIPYRKEIRTSILAGLTAQRIYQDLVELHCFKGSYDSVKRYVRKFKKRCSPYFDRLPTLAGYEAQVDFAKSPCRVLVNGKYRHIWFFKMTLSHSRHSYEELVLRQDTETFIRCHENAFKSFNGIPETIKLDNLKAGVIQACIYDPLINPVYKAFSEHYGFIPNPCAPVMPHHKGRVERDVRYTESNALEGRSFNSVEDGNIFLRQWNKRWARTRIHGTTKCQVWKLFLEVEQPRLKPLPQNRFAYFTVYRRKVDVSGLIEVGCNFYSAPARNVGDWVFIHYNSIEVKIYTYDEKQKCPPQLLVRHKTLTGKGHCSQQANCKPTWKHPSLEDQEAYYCRKARQIGTCCHALVYHILTADDPMAIRRTRGILSLQKNFSNETIENACSIAIYRQAYNYPAVHALCETISEKGVVEEHLLTQVHDAIRPLEEYQSLVEERISAVYGTTSNNS